MLDPLCEDDEPKGADLVSAPWYPYEAVDKLPLYLKLLDDRHRLRAIYDRLSIFPARLFVAQPCSSATKALPNLIACRTLA